MDKQFIQAFMGGLGQYLAQLFRVYHPWQGKRFSNLTKLSGDVNKDVHFIIHTYNVLSAHTGLHMYLINR